jgi:inositol hexakisphosphate/diphosphoinositol-pentakisphosphate kinase
VASGIDVPRHACLSRDDCVSTGSGDGNGAKDQEVTEHDDHNVEVNSISIQKPFVEKSIDADHNNVSICCPSSAGGGCEKLFRNAGNRSSEFYPNVNEVWRDGSRVYEEFLETQGACVKIHAAGPERGHAKARKSTTVDGKVQRNPNGKEIRFPVILTLREKEIVRRVVLGFKQLVRGFDLPCVQEGQFMSDFQKMRTMMSRMSKMMGPGGAPGGMDPAVEGADMDVSQMPGANRALRRSSKEKKKSGKGGGGGFG